MGRRPKVKENTTVINEEVKVEETVATEAVAVETEVTEAPAKKATRKACAKKATAKKEECVTNVVIQFQGNEVTAATIEEKVKAQFVEEGHRAGTIKSLSIYVKPEEYSAYYVINEKHEGRVDLF
ncbi:MAG: hypothetical protein IKJ01_08835 [Lachnospiraceae bacterium]|nr:hypothetical protein [Lachnospiraceae bacterium]